jgi:hypothetical protein
MPDSLTATLRHPDADVRFYAAWAGIVVIGFPPAFGYI